MDEEMTQKSTNIVPVPAKILHGIIVNAKLLLLDEKHAAHARRVYGKKFANGEVDTLFVFETVIPAEEYTEIRLTESLSDQITDLVLKGHDRIVIAREGFTLGSIPQRSGDAFFDIIATEYPESTNSENLAVIGDGIIAIADDHTIYDSEGRKEAKDHTVRDFAAAHILV